MNGVLLWSAVGAVGGLGALARFELDGLVQLRATGEFPLGTFVLGLLTGLSITGDAVLLAGTGFLGSFTTFSTWMLETERLAEDGESRLAFANLVLSLLGGAAAAVAGWAIGAVL